MINSFQNHLHQKAIDLSKSFQRTEFELIDILQRISEARVFLALGYSSLYSYAYECLGLSEANAYTFTAVAKKSNQIPELKAEIKIGNLSVSKAKRLIPVITPENKAEWISKAIVLPKAALEKAVALASPEAEKRESLRPISNDRFSLKLGISENLVQKLKRAQIVLMNKNRKNLSLEETLELMTEDFLKRNDPVEKAKRLAPSSTDGVEMKNPVDPIKGVPGFFQSGDGKRKPIPRSRRPIPNHVKHAVHQRDQGRCQFESTSQTDGLSQIGPGPNRSYGDVKKKCRGMAYIEIHHKRPVAQGGSNAPENLITLCSRHHAYAHLQTPTLFSTENMN